MTEIEIAWDKWIKRHALIFGFHTDRDMQMLLEWNLLFARAGFTPEELQEATEWLALNAHPRFPADHLALLSQRVRVRRGERDQVQEMLRRRDECRRKREAVQQQSECTISLSEVITQLVAQGKGGVSCPK